MAQEASEWQQGTLDGATYRPELATTLAVMTAARDQVSKLPPYPGQPMVDRLYLASMTLYVISAQSDQASLDLEPALRRQVALLAERVRELGDRVFDQGRLLTGQSLVPAGLSGARVELPAAVPDWTGEGLAAGPPLAPAPPASVDRHAAEPSGGTEVRLRLAGLVQAEAQLASVAAGLTSGPEAAMLRGVSSGLGDAARLIT
jgi:hypothetical protein